MLFLLADPKFVHQRLGHAVARFISAPRLCANPCESENWPPLQLALDKLPVFTVANLEKQPLQFQMGDDRKVSAFYADLEVAKEQVEKAQEQYPDLGCDIIATGLGSAFKLSCQGTAVIVPSIAELRAAGAPETLADAIGQEVPMFACMGLRGEGEDEAQKVPLYMSAADCAAAVEAADNASLEIDAILSLRSVVEECLELSDPLSGEFCFRAPSGSLQHVESYVGQGVYVRKLEDVE